MIPFRFYMISKVDEICHKTRQLNKFNQVALALLLVFSFVIVV